ncbi:MAG: cell division protein FtsQ/DivIB [Bacillota bacterium]
MDRSKFGILLILLLIIGLVSFLNSNYFTVREVHIKGNDLLSDKEILEMCDLNEEINIFNVQQEELANKLIELPQVKGAKVKRDLPRDIFITIEERIPTAVISNKKTNLVIDKQGWILDTIKTIDAVDLPVFVDQELVNEGDKVKLTKDSKLAVNYLSKLSKDLLKEVKEFKILTSGNVELLLREGGKVNLGKEFNIDKKAKVFNKIYTDLEQKGVEIEYINLKYNRNIFIKVKK